MSSLQPLRDLQGLESQLLNEQQQNSQNMDEQTRGVASEHINLEIREQRERMNMPGVAGIMLFYVIQLKSGK